MNHVVLTEEAAREIWTLAGEWLRLWSFRLRHEAIGMRGSGADEAAALRPVHNAMHACIEAIFKRYNPSYHGDAEWTYLSLIRCGTPERTAAVQRLCNAAYDAFLNENERLLPEMTPREAWQALKSVWEAAEGPLAASEPHEAKPHEGSHEKGEFTPGARAIAAAYDLRTEGKPVSLRAACERAKVDRANLCRNFPEAATMIKALSKADRAPRRGVRDRRTGDVDAVDYDDD